MNFWKDTRAVTRPIAKPRKKDPEKTPMKTPTDSKNLSTWNPVPVLSNRYVSTDLQRQAWFNSFIKIFRYNAHCHWLKERALPAIVKTKSWAKAVVPVTNLYYVRPFPRLHATKEEGRNIWQRLMFPRALLSCSRRFLHALQ